MAMIPLAKYAAMHGRAAISVRQMAQRGGLRTARKQGRDWMIDEAEPYPDRRRRMADVITDEGYKGTDPQERRDMLRMEQARQYSRTGGFGDTFSANWRRIPVELKEDLTPERLGWIVDLLHQAYVDGQRHPDEEWLQAGD